MKSISFEQIKTMLKSMSYPIFTRIGRAEKNVQNLSKQVSDLKTQIPAKPQKIIFRQNSSNEYTCDLTFDDLWAMEPEQIASNAILIDRYGTEKTARSARKAGSVEYGVRNIQIDVDGSFEADMYTYFKPTLIIDWWAHADATTINVHTASSLSNQKIGAVDVPNVPILRAGNWGNYAIGPGLKVDEVAATPTLEINAGEGLEVVDDALRVKPEGEYELIETITLTANSAITRTQEPDGTPYKLKKVMVKTQFSTTGAYSAGGAYAYFKCKNTNIGYMWYGDLNINTAATRYHVDNAKIENGKWLIEWQDWTAVATMQFKSAFKDINTYDAKTYDAIDTIQINQILPAGTIIEIWGVRADA